MRQVSIPDFELRYAGTTVSRVYYGTVNDLPQLVAAGSSAPHRVFLCTDERVQMLHADRVGAALTAAGLEVSTITIPAGEQHKTLAVVNSVYARFAALRAERTDPVVALGGGVVGDLFGFVAATYLRGLPLIQVPSTVVAQVESSIGGKVGVDLEEGKNLVGAFKHPDIVLIDNTLLATLSDAEWIAG